MFRCPEYPQVFSREPGDEGRVVAAAGDVAREAPAWPQAMATGPFIDIPYSLLHPDRGKRGAMFKRRSEVEKFLAVDDLLDRLHAHTGRRVRDVVRAGMAGLALMASGPYLAWLPLELLARVPCRPLAPLPLAFERRCQTGLALRRSAESLAPVRALREFLREAAHRGRG